MYVVAMYMYVCTVLVATGIRVRFHCMCGSINCSLDFCKSPQCEPMRQVNCQCSVGVYICLACIVM